MATSKVEKTLRDALSTISDLRRELAKVRKAGEAAVAQQFERATSSSAAEIAKLRDELDRVRDTTSKQIADLTAIVARLAPDALKTSSGEAAKPADEPTSRPHGDPLGSAAKKAAAEKPTVTKPPATKTPAKKAPATDPADQRLTMKGEALAASEGASVLDEDPPGTTQAAPKKTAAKKAPAQKTTAKKAPSAAKGAKSTAQRDGSGGKKTTARKAPAKKAPATKAPTPTPDNPAVADRPAAD